MYDEPLSVDVRELLDSCIDSVDALDALLLLQRDPTRGWSLLELARAIDVDVESARKAVGDLRGRGLAADVPAETAEGSLVRLAPLDHFSHAAFAALARTCTAERTAVVAHVSRRSMARLAVFAEAFTRGRSP